MAKMHEKMIELALADGLLVSVYDGEEWAVKRSADKQKILEAIEAVEEAGIVLRDAEGKKIGTALILPYGVGDDETVADHTDNDAMNKLYERAAAALESA